MQTSNKCCPASGSLTSVSRRSALYVYRWGRWSSRSWTTDSGTDRASARSRQTNGWTVHPRPELTVRADTSCEQLWIMYLTINKYCPTPRTQPTPSPVLQFPDWVWLGIFGEVINVGNACETIYPSWQKLHWCPFRIGTIAFKGYIGQTASKLIITFFESKSTLNNQPVNISVKSF